MNWCPEKDELSLEIRDLVVSWEILRNSKRCVFQTASQIFDPIGLISPFVVCIKLLLQEIWETGFDWDEELPDDLSEKWIKWCKETEKLCEVTIPRYCLLDCKNEKVEAHVFCDASISALDCLF